MNKTSKNKLSGNVKNTVKSAFFTLPQGKRQDNELDNMSDILQDKLQDKTQDNYDDKPHGGAGGRFELTRPDRKDTRISFRLRKTTIERLKRAAEDSNISINEAAGQIFDTYLASVGR